MGRIVVLIGVLLVTLGTVMPADAIWIVCWDRKVVGVAADGTKVYCRKCESKEMGQGWNKYANRPDCKIFVNPDEAEKWSAARCDCP
jgi:hypothetical protein